MKSPVWILTLLMAAVLITGGVPARPLHAQAEAEAEQGFSSHTVASRILDEERTIYIGLPDSYPSSRSTYPVLLHLDAGSESSFREWNSHIRNMLAQNDLPEMIVAGVTNTDRNRDMIPISVPQRPGSGEADRFLEFLTAELGTWLESRYRVSGRVILFGLSNSALFAVWALLTDPASFPDVIASSPTIGHCPEHITDLARRTLPNRPDRKSLLFMVYGDEDVDHVTRYVPAFVTLLDELHPPGLEWEHVILEGQGYVPPSGLERGLRWIMRRER